MSKQRIQLSDHFTYFRLLRFVLPCIGTTLFTSIYGIVDGLCVSNFVGKTAFAAVNLIIPLPMLLGTIGFMLGTGGSAIVGITLGEGDQKKADRYFTLFLLAALVSVSVLAVLGIVFLRPIAVLLGAKGELLDYAVRYGRILMLALPPFALQNMFQSIFVTAEKPHLGFWFTVGAGCTNIVLDVLIVGVWGWGVEGAAIATFISQLVGGVLPVFYFIDRSNSSRLHLCKTSFYSKVLRDACINGSSELMTNLSMSLVNILYNYQLLRLAGENGVAAYGVIMIRGLPVRGGVRGLCRGQCTHRQLPLRCPQPHRGAQPLPEKPAAHRRGGCDPDAGFHVHHPLCSAHFRGLRCGVAGPDQPCLPAVCAELPHHGLQRVCVLLLHGAGRRRDQRVDLLFAHAGISGDRHSPAAAAAGHRRHLAGRHRRRAGGSGRERCHAPCQGQGVPLPKGLIRSPAFCETAKSGGFFW